MKFHRLIPSEVQAVFTELDAAGYEAVLVGGCVRDALLGRIPHDWDVATSAMPEQVCKLFPKTIPTGIQHGTVTVMMGEEPVEVTTFRSEGKYTDGRHPDRVTFGVTLQEDLARRDFTINAIAYDPIKDQLIDPFGGLVDIKRECIRTVGLPQHRFSEDGLRMMRAVRFMATLDMQLDFDTRNGIRASLETLKGVSSERIRTELLKLLGAEKPSVALSVAMNTGLLGQFIPELTPSHTHPQNKYHKYNVWEHVLVTVDHSMPDPIHRMGALLHDVAKPATAEPAYGDGQFSFYGHAVLGAEIAQEITTRLKFSNEDQERIVGMVRHHMALFGYDESSNKKILRRIVKKVGNLLPDILCLSMADVIAKGTGEDPEVRFAGIRERLWEVMGEIASGEAAVSTNQLAINGHDVMQELNIPPGKAVGDAMKALLEKVLDEPELNERETLLKLLREEEK